jgi:pyruvate dehydrogenase E2 component (dihydrolipoamide acetyltransferase)
MSKIMLKILYPVHIRRHRPGRLNPFPDITKRGDVEREQVTTNHRKIADTLTYTRLNVPQITQYNKADITGLDETRKEFSEKAENAPKLIITSIKLKIVVSALKEFPKFNARFDTENNEIIYKKYVHISIAVETDRSLLVPVIRDAGKLVFKSDLAVEMVTAADDLAITIHPHPTLSETLMEADEQSSGRSIHL